MKSSRSSRGYGSEGRTRRLAMGALLALALPGLTAGAIHITPTVVIEKQADVIRSTLPGATQYFVKTVQIGKQDLKRIEEEADFEPESPEVKFFYGEDGSGNAVGVVLFPQVNTQHGPFEIGLTVGPDGRVRRVRLTKATVETKPWVKQAASQEFLADFEGLTAGEPATRALARLQAAGLGAMPTWAGKQVALAVQQGLELHRILYAGGD
ncbi:MAG: hypothetical protein Q8W46_00515 [Candidatus Palauibacterales bacterium]|nr:hypothetical protein [Candidatus Palauibacterales bacterium]